MSNPVDKGRRKFISGKLAELPARLSASSFITPPWISSPSKLDACTGCGNCVSACPDHLISLSTNKTPVMNFTASGCDYCGDCAKSCEADVFLPLDERTHENAWQQQAHINHDCLNYKGVICHSCQDICEPGAIIFSRDSHNDHSIQTEDPSSFQLNIAKPFISEDVCDGCGFCLSICPIDAIDIIKI